MDETIKIEKSNMIEYLREFQQLIDDTLIPSIEKVPYEKKYDFINQIKDISKDIALYLYFPEIINKTVVGIYQPDQKGYKDNDLLPLIPSIVYKKEANENIRILNLAENIIMLDKKEYFDLIHLSEQEELNLSSMLHMVSIPLDQVEDGFAYITIPNNVVSIPNLVDILCIPAKECKLSNICCYCNISQIWVYGNISKQKKEKVEVYCNRNNIEIKYLNTFQWKNLIPQIKNNINCFDREKDSQQKKTNGKRNNFCYIYILENLLYEMVQYLASKKEELQKPLKDINDNLLFKDNISYESVKKIQIQYKENINQVEQIYHSYKTVIDKLMDTIKIIQQQLGIQEGNNCFNEHISMNTKLLELLIKLEESYKVFPISSSKEIVRNYAKIYVDVTGQQQIANVIINDFFGNAQKKEELAAFKKMDTTSSFILRKKVKMYKELGLSTEECGKIITQLSRPVNSMEKKMLGVYFLEQNRRKKAKELLLSAAQDGEEEAGELLFESGTYNQKELYLLADYGVSKAAFQIGKELYSNIQNLKEISPKNRTKCLKYLHIAASKSHLKAIKLLGDIAYDLWETQKKEKQLAEESLHYYLLAEKYGSKDRKILERIGNCYYFFENYKDAIVSFEKSDSADSNYNLGVIYQNGLGCATNEKTALKYFDKAMKQGHLEAQVAYEKLTIKIEEKKKKHVVSEEKNYESELYTTRAISSSAW